MPKGDYYICMKNVAVIFLTCTQSAGALALPKNDYCSNHKE